MSKVRFPKIIALIISVIILLCACSSVPQTTPDVDVSSSSLNEDTASLQGSQQIPEFDGRLLI